MHKRNAGKQVETQVPSVQRLLLVLAIAYLVGIEDRLHFAGLMKAIVADANKT